GRAADPAAGDRRRTGRGPPHPRRRRHRARGRHGRRRPPRRPHRRLIGTGTPKRRCPDPGVGRGTGVSGGAGALPDPEVVADGPRTHVVETGRSPGLRGADGAGRFVETDTIADVATGATPVHLILQISVLGSSTCISSVLCGRTFLDDLVCSVTV